MCHMPSNNWLSKDKCTHLICHMSYVKTIQDG
jgi:hypothetical protein